MGIVKEYRLEKKYNHNILSVIYDSDSFFYGISDVNGNLMMACKYDLDNSSPESISEIIEKENLADHYYSAVNIFNRSSKFSFVPVSEYVYGMESLVAKNTFDISKSRLEVNLCGDEHLHIIHAVNEDFDSGFTSLRQDLECRHISLAYIQGLQKDGLYAFIEEGKTSILFRDNGSFVFYNQFETPKLEDHIYFIMLSFDQLNIDASKATLFIDGKHEIVSNLKESLAPYVRSFSSTSMGFSNIDDSSEIMDLYLASICE